MIFLLFASFSRQFAGFLLLRVSVVGLRVCGFPWTVWRASVGDLWVACDWVCGFLFPRRRLRRGTPINPRDSRIYLTQSTHCNCTTAEPRVLGILQDNAMERKVALGNQFVGGVPKTPAAGSSTAIRVAALRREHDDDMVEALFPELPAKKRWRRGKDGNLRRLACPMHKWEPTTYAQCGGIGWVFIPDVIRHLSACHRSPLYCSRCENDFESTEERNRHLRYDGCENVPRKARVGYGEGPAHALVKVWDGREPIPVRWAKIYWAVCKTLALPRDPYVEGNRRAAKNR